jgi:hypothetical protein
MENRNDEAGCRQGHDGGRQPSDPARPSQNDEGTHDLAVGTDLPQQHHDWSKSPCILRHESIRVCCFARTGVRASTKGMMAVAVNAAANVPTVRL